MNNSTSNAMPNRLRTKPRTVFTFLVMVAPTVFLEVENSESAIQNFAFAVFATEVWIPSI